MRILVVEDEPTLATQLAEGIQSVGYVVDVAHNGVDGHFMGETEPYDAIVLDIGLPNEGDQQHRDHERNGVGDERR